MGTNIPSELEKLRHRDAMIERGKSTLERLAESYGDTLPESICTDEARFLFGELAVVSDQLTEIGDTVADLLSLPAMTLVLQLTLVPFTNALLEAYGYGERYNASKN